MSARKMATNVFINEFLIMIIILSVLVNVIIASNVHNENNNADDDEFYKSKQLNNEMAAKNIQNCLEIVI